MSKKILTNTKITKILQEFPAWNYDADKKSLCFSYKFKSFEACFAMMIRIAMLAEKQNHHPDWFNSYRRLDIALTSHDVGGITMRDIKMMRTLTQLFSDLVVADSA